MSKVQRRDRDETPSPFKFLFCRKDDQQDLPELEEEWIPFLERALKKAKDLADKLKDDKH